LNAGRLATQASKAEKLTAYGSAAMLAQQVMALHTVLQRPKPL
jgi:hypothetical protein